MSDEAREAAYRAGLEERWRAVAEQYPGAARPEVRRIRFVSSEEMPQAISACLTEQGFTASDASDEFGPAVQASSPAGQEQALAIAWYECDASYPIDPVLTQPLSDEEIRYLYAYNVSVLVPCLADEGYQVSDPPSEQTYLEEFGTPGAWIPYAEISPSSAEELARLGDACPQNPTGLRE
jgi:hypothetical protein